MNKQDLALNNLQRMICHKTQLPNLNSVCLNENGMFFSSDLKWFQSFISEIFVACYHKKNIDKNVMSCKQ